MWWEHSGSARKRRTVLHRCHCEALRAHLEMRHSGYKYWKRSILYYVTMLKLRTLIFFKFLSNFFDLSWGCESWIDIEAFSPSWEEIIAAFLSFVFADRICVFFTRPSSVWSLCPDHTSMCWQSVVDWCRWLWVCFLLLYFCTLSSWVFSTLSSRKLFRAQNSSQSGMVHDH